jgi:hypothetical protein
MKSFSIPIFDINDTLRPINVPRVLALLKLGLEGLGNDDAESTYREFCEALTEIPPC